MYKKNPTKCPFEAREELMLISAHCCILLKGELLWQNEWNNARRKENFLETKTSCQHGWRRKENNLDAELARQESNWTWGTYNPLFNQNPRHPELNLNTKVGLFVWDVFGFLFPCVTDDFWLSSMNTSSMASCLTQKNGQKLKKNGHFIGGTLRLSGFFLLGSRWKFYWTTDLWGLFPRPQWNSCVQKPMDVDPIQVQPSDDEVRIHGQVFRHSGLVGNADRSVGGLFSRQLSLSKQGMHWSSLCLRRS